MLSIPRPALIAEQVYRNLVNGTQDPNLRGRLLGAASQVDQASSAFDQALLHGAVHSLVPISDTDLQALNVTRDELVAVYSQRMVRKRAPGRRIYDALLAAAPLGLCPMCAHRDASTLDHYLPKGRFTDLVVTPANLVPCCKDCNLAKHEGWPTNREEELLHPYFDNVDGEQWLAAAVRQTQPATVAFFVAPPTQWPAVEKQRIREHFRVFNLAKLYGSQSAVELINIQFHMKRLHRAGGAAAVRSQLFERHRSWAQVRRNSWQAVLFGALANSSWYCDGGFTS
jgi:5-methylcytosine-specific restriction endonuclease McrA